MMKRKRKKKSWKGRFFSSIWVLEYFLVCFVFEKMSTSFHMLLIMLFIHVEKRSNSRSQMLFKTGVLKSFAIQIHRKTPVLESLFNKVTGLKDCILIKKETPTAVFYCEYCKIFRNSFFIEHIFIILFRNFM